MVAHRERSVSEIASPFEMSLAAVSKHVKTLESAGLVERRWMGREARCRLNPDALVAAEAWLHHHRQFWTARLDALERVLRRGARPPRRSR